MGWHKLKLVLAAVLAAANLLMLFLILRQARSSDYLPAEAVTEITALLERDGISLAEGALQTKKQSLVIYSGDIGDTYYADTAAAVSRSDVSLSFSTPSGVVFTMINGDRCAFEGGFRLRYDAAGCAGLLAKAGFGEFPIDGAGENLYPLSAAEERSVRDTVSRFLADAAGTAERSLQYEIEYEVRFCGTEPRTQVQYAVCTQLVKGTAITNLRSVFAVQGDRVIGMRGKWCFSEIHTTYSAQLYDQINILYKAKDRIAEERNSVHTVLTSLSLAYAVYYHADSDLFYLIPTWNITTDEGNTYILNAVNGSLYTD